MSKIHLTLPLDINYRVTIKTSKISNRLKQEVWDSISTALPSRRFHVHEYTSAFIARDCQRLL
jgi:hypothetical protein